MQQTLVWKPWSHPGVEHLRLHRDADGVHVSSHLMQSRGGSSFAATYVLDYDPEWRFRQLWLKVDDHGPRSLRLQRANDGRWTLDGQPCPDLEPCDQVMLGASPFTHSPILLGKPLETWEEHTHQVAHIDLPTLTVQARPQRYRCVKRDAQLSRYHWEQEGDAGGELTLDHRGLATRLEGQFLRLDARTLRLAELPINTWV